jgi:hypothetical protein
MRQQEFGWGIATVRREVKDQVLAPSREINNPMIANLPRERARAWCGDDTLPTHSYANDGALDEVRLQIAHSGFDFGEFGHGAMANEQTTNEQMST